jgi:hypothetical protein
MYLRMMAIIVIGMMACTPKVKTSLSQSQQALDYKEEVFVIGVSEEAPASAVELGTVKIGDTGFSTDCGWEKVIESARMEARKAGGNVLKLTEHKSPSFGSSCHRIKARILRIQDPSELTKLKQAAAPATIDSTWDYAKLYVYRHKGVGSLIGYDLYLGDSLLCRVKNNSKQEIKIFLKGPSKLWAKTESKAEVPIDITMGREYYLRCGIRMGVMVGRPELQLVDSREGQVEYNTIKTKKKK